MSNHSEDSFTADIVITVSNSVSVLVCFAASFLVFYFNLYKAPVYRLALYQVLASLAFATVEVFQVIFINYGDDPAVYGKACSFVGWMTIYARWVKLIFTAWVTFHLFCFAVLHRNMKKLEALYVITSVLVPLPIASVPLLTRTYGVNRLGICFYFAANDTGTGIGTIEKLSLWYVPAMLILLASSVAMVVMLIAVARRMCWRSSYEPITEGDAFWTAFKQLLPLTAFPVLFFIFIIPVFVSGLFLSFGGSSPANGSLAYSTLCVSLWSMSSGLTLLIHIAVTKCFAKRKRAFKQYEVQPLN